MSGLKHYKYDEIAFGKTVVGDQQTSIARLINTAMGSTTMGAGIERLEKTRLEWTVTYDEVLFIREGTIVRLSDRFHRRRVTPVFTRRNCFRLRWYILHRGKRLRRREVRAARDSAARYPARRRCRAAPRRAG